MMFCTHWESTNVCEYVDAEASVGYVQRLFFLCGPGAACLSSIIPFLVIAIVVCLLRYVIGQCFSQLVS